MAAEGKGELNSGLGSSMTHRMLNWLTVGLPFSPCASGHAGRILPASTTGHATNLRQLGCGSLRASL